MWQGCGKGGAALIRQTVVEVKQRQEQTCWTSDKQRKIKVTEKRQSEKQMPENRDANEKLQPLRRRVRGARFLNPILVSVSQLNSIS